MYFFDKVITFSLIYVYIFLNIKGHKYQLVRQVIDLGIYLLNSEIESCT